MTDWSGLLARVGPSDKLEASAKATGALVRRRQVGSAGDLLRLCFAFVLGRLSLRMLVAWAEERGVASLSDVAALKRLKGSADWVGILVAERLAARYPESAAGSTHLVAVDATMVVPPGDKRDYWLVHTVFDLASLSFRNVEISGRCERERLDRGGVRAGEVRIADRGHARAEDLAAVKDGGADFLVRAASNYPRLVDSDGPLGKRLDRLALCRQADREGCLDRTVVVASAKTKSRVPARLVILPLPGNAAGKARTAARRNANHWGYAASQAGIEMAGHLMLLTSLPKDDWPPDRLLAAYRLRWQVELAFKRMKSIVGLEDLRAKDPDLARLWINTALLVAVLAEDDLPDLASEGPDSLHRAKRAGPHCQSGALSP